MKVLFLTYNPNLVSSTRVLQDWLAMGPDMGITGYVALRQLGDFSAWLAQESIPYEISSMPWPHKWWPWRSLHQAGRLARWIKSEGIDVIQCNEHDVYPFGWLLARLANRPIVCHIRCKIEPAFARWAFRWHKPDALLWSTEQMRLEGSPLVESIITENRQHVVPLGVRLNGTSASDKVTPAKNDGDVGNSQYVIREGINLTRFGRSADSRASMRSDWQAVDGDVVVGMACALRPGKRVEDFLAIAEQLRPALPRVTFVLAGGAIIGEEAYTSQLIPRIRMAEGAGYVRWLGHLEPVEPFLHSIDLFVSTSQHESFGMSVCEAMACGKPVAAYAACSVAEVVGEGGLVVETRDVEALTNAVKRLTSDDELRSQLGVLARKRVETQFNPAQSLGQLKQIYEKITTNAI